MTVLSMKERVDAVVGMSFLAAFVMLVGGLMSLFSFIEYLAEGEIVVNLAAVPCIALSVVFIFVFMVLTVPVARFLLSSEATSVRRASYFAILFPVLLVSFLLATPQASFAPFLTFGWPLLLLGAVAYPYAAVVMRRGVLSAQMKHLLMVECFRCTYVFEMHKEEPVVRCPYCGQVNMNPTMGEGKPAPPSSAPTEEGVSP